MYDSLFCRVYNEFGWNEYPRVFGENLLRWLERSGADVSSALDLGCGTGVLCETLHARGIDTLGVDLSADMIAVARQRSPGLSYAVGDMVSYLPNRRFDLVTCTGDALNHVTDLADVARVFANAREALNPGGLFAFDLLKDDEVPLGEPFEATFTQRLTVRFTAARDDEGFTELRIEGFEDGIPKFSERIREKLHDVDAVCALLRESGFDVIQRGDRLLAEDARGTTWFIIGRRS